MPFDFQRVQSVFQAVAGLSPGEREAELKQACGDDVELRRQIEALLKGHDDPEELPPADPRRTGAYVPSAEPGQVFAGRFKLREKLGEGGMGTVFVADQTEPVTRRVALKIIKSGADSARLLARFEQERQALALMDHPNIAKVFDAGVGEGGQPYFAMELVKGLPLTKYCDDARLSPRQRLELFVPVCQAVQHAHQKGIIHRDLKPSNILVGLYDGRPMPKVIDFGVAKATGPRLTDQSIYTEVGSLIGTLEYMSPEQAELNNLDIDTRSDIYALGVILYELLTGSVPFSRKELEKAGLAEMLRIIKQSEPAKPSTKLSGSGTLPSIAAARQTEPKKLTALMRGELDWIVMKALEKERNRRYETANGFAMDVQRYLAGEAVLAAPASQWYRVRKFVRRNRAPVIASGLVTFALLAGIAGTSWGLIEANRQEKIAKQNEAAAKAETTAKEQALAAEKTAVTAKDSALRTEQAAVVAKEAALKDAERNLAYAKKGNEILGSVFSGLDPEAKYETLAEFRNALKKNLENAEKQLDGSGIGDPLAVAEMQNTLGSSLLGLGEYAQAITSFQKSLETRKAKLGPDHSDTLQSMNNLALGYHDAGKLDLALPLFEATVKLMKTKLGTDHPSTLNSMSNLAMCYQAAGKLDLAQPLLEETVKLKKVKRGLDHLDTLKSMNNLAMCYRAAGKLDLALPLFEATLKMTKAKLAADHPFALISMSNLAVGYQSAGKLDLALPLLEETLKRMKAKLGSDHLDTLTSMNNLAAGYGAGGRIDLALPLLEETLKLRRAKLGSDHPDTLQSMNNLATSYHETGKLDLALPLFEETLKLRKAKLGPDHPDTLESMNNLAMNYKEAGKLDLALPLLKETLKLINAKLGPDHANTLQSMNNLALGYLDARRLDLALPLFEETLKLRRAKLGPDHPNTFQSMNNLASGYQAAGKLDLALPLFEETLKLRRAKLSPDHPDILESTNNLASGYRAAGRLDRALPLLEETLKMTKVKLGSDHPDTLRCMNNLAGGYRAAGKLDLAVPLWEETLKLVRVRLGPDHAHTLATMGNLAFAYGESKRGPDAAKLFQEYIDRQRKKLPAPMLAGQLAMVSVKLLQCDEYTTAEKFLRECLTIREKNEPEAWTTFNTQSLLGEALLRQKKYAEAEPLLLQGYEGMKAREKANPSQGSARIPEALDWLVKLYQAVGKTDEAKKYQELRAKYSSSAAQKK